MHERWLKELCIILQHTLALYQLSYQHKGYVNKISASLNRPLFIELKIRVKLGISWSNFRTILEIEGFMIRIGS